MVHSKDESRNEWSASPTTAGAPWRQQWRRLVETPAFLVFAVLVSPLVGYAFLSAATTPNVTGNEVVVRTFRAYIAALAVLFPFAAVAVASAEKQRGEPGESSRALARRLLVLLTVLCAACVVAWVPGIVAVALWRATGGAVNGALVASVLAGQLLRGAVVASIALLFVAVMRGPKSALVLTLAFTLSTWALDYLAREQGGPIQLLAALAPEGMLRAFERGEVRLDVIGVMALTVASNLAVAIVWQNPRRDRGERWGYTIGILVVTTALTALIGDLPGAWTVDLSEQAVPSPPFSGSTLAALLFYLALPALTLWWFRAAVRRKKGNPSSE